MKKLLSILSIGAVLASTSPALVACNNSKPGPTTQPKLDLTKLNVYDLGVTQDAANLVVNNTQIYINAELQIMNDFNAFASALTQPETLKLSNFVVGDASALTDTATWAIQILNTDGETPIPAQATQGPTTPLMAWTNALANNALTIKISTKDANVKGTSKLKDGDTTTTTTVKINGYLNKYAYTNANANQNKDVTENTTKSAADNKLVKANVIDITAAGYTANTITLNANAASVVSIKTDSQKKLYKTVVDNLNKQLKTADGYLNKNKILSQATDTGSLNLTTTNTKLILAPVSGNISKLDIGAVIPNGTLDTTKVFAVVNMPALDNYIAFPNARVYVYLGTVSTS